MRFPTRTKIKPSPIILFMLIVSFRPRPSKIISGIEASEEVIQPLGSISSK